MSTCLKMKVAITLLLGIILSGRWLPGAGQGQKTAWKGRIETENGIKVVKNPADPLYGELILQLEENLSIGGNETEEAYYFPKGAWLSVDEGGNIYVCDSGNRRVQMYDQAGKYIRTVGRKGQGPGEYMFPSQVLFDGEGNPCVSGGRDLNIYGKDGVFKKKIVLKTFLSQFIFGPHDTIIGTTQARFQPGGPKVSILLLDPEGSLVRTVADFSGEFAKSKNSIVLHWYSSNIGISPLTADSFCYGFSSDYRIYVADGEGRTTLIIAKEEKPQPISNKEKEETKKRGIYAWMGQSESADAKKDIVFPDNRPYFGRLMADDAGRIYVTRAKSILDEGTARAFDVFSKDGPFLYRMKLPFSPVLIKAGFVYEIRENKDTGEIKIIRHKIKNWDQIRKGI